MIFVKYLVLSKLYYEKKYIQMRIILWRSFIMFYRFLLWHEDFFSYKNVTL